MEYTRCCSRSCPASPTASPRRQEEQSGHSPRPQHPGRLPACRAMLADAAAPQVFDEIAKELDVHGHGIPVTVASTTYMGMNALHAAGGYGKLPAYWYLVEEVKMDINKPDTSMHCTPVEHAINYGNLPAVRYLLDHGADLHQKRSGNVTLLHSAAVRGSLLLPCSLVLCWIDHACSIKCHVGEHVPESGGNAMVIGVDLLHQEPS